MIRLIATIIFVGFNWSPIAAHPEPIQPVKRAGGDLEDTWTINNESVYGILIEIDENAESFKVRDLETSAVTGPYEFKELIPREAEYLRQALSGEVEGKVIGIVDGDTLDVLTDEKRRLRIRLHGIDAPERGEDYNRKAKEHLSDLAYLKMVHLHFQSTDKWGRMVATIFDEGLTLDLNLEMIKAGYARYDDQYLKESSEYGTAEDDAKQLKRGMWASARQMKPKSKTTSRPAVEKRESISLPAPARKLPASNRRLTALDAKGAPSFRFQGRKSLSRALWKRPDPNLELYWLTPNSKKYHQHGGCFRFATTTKGTFGKPCERTLCKDCAKKLSPQEKSPPPQ